MGNFCSKSFHYSTYIKYYPLKTLFCVLEHLTKRPLPIKVRIMSTNSMVLQRNQFSKFSTFYLWSLLKNLFWNLKCSLIFICILVFYRLNNVFITLNITLENIKHISFLSFYLIHIMKI